MYDVIIEDATIVSGRGRQVADIAIKKGRIAYVGPRPLGRARDRINAIGKFIMPGIIDGCATLAGPGGETWASGSRAAVSSGVTCVLELPVGDAVCESPAALEARRRAARKGSRCHYGIWATATADNVGALPALLDAGAIGIEAHLSRPDGPSLPAAALPGLFAGAGPLRRAPLMLRLEDAALIEQRAAALAEVEPPDNEARPPESAQDALRQVIALVRQSERPVHITHLTTADEIHLLDPIGGELPITVSVCPQHLFLSVENNSELVDLLKCDPPIRSEQDRRALWTALKRGRLDSIASGHAPWTRAEKRRPYWQAPAGLPGVETTFPLILSSVQHGRLSLERMVELLSENPARIFGLKGKGAVEVGRDADLVLFSEGDSARLSRAAILSKCNWSPFFGRDAAPKPELVMVAGRPVARRGEIIDDKARGSEVTHQ